MIISNDIVDIVVVMMDNHTKVSSSTHEGDNDPPEVGDRVYISPFYPGSSTKYDSRHAVILSKSKTRYRLHVEGLVNKGIYRWCTIKDATKVSTKGAANKEIEGEKIVGVFQKELKALLKKTYTQANKEVLDFVVKNTITILIEQALEEQKRNT